MSSYIILNNKLQRIGILDDDHPGATPFYGDLITKQIADEKATYDVSSVNDNLTTLNKDLNANNKSWNHVLESIYIPYGYPDTDKIAQGNHLAFKDNDNGKYYVFRLTSVTDSVDSAGNHYKSATGVNLCIWKLGKTIPPKHNLKNANSNDAFNNLLASTDWYLDPTADLVGSSFNIDFDGTSSAQSQLQSFCSLYGAEIDAYVFFNESWHITMKRVEILPRLGTNNGQRIQYARNVTGITRTVVDDNLFTKLYVYGPNGATCANAKNKNKPFVKDDFANVIYNPNTEYSYDEHGNAIGDADGDTYLEGAITSNSITNPYALYNWGLQQLEIFNHPRANYEVEVAQNFDAQLGDTVKVLDLEMKPELTVQARVIQKKTSFSDWTQNKLVLGEFTTVNVIPPQFIKNMINSMKNHLSDLLDEVRMNPTALSAYIEKPDGTSWSDMNTESKRFNAHVAVLGEDITANIENKGFSWDLISPNGLANHLSGGESDGEYSDGPNLTLSNHEVGELRLSVDTNYITDIPEVNFSDNNVKHIFTVDKWTNHWGEARQGALQYIQYSEDENCYYTSTVYRGKQDPTKYAGQQMTSEIIRLDVNGNYLDSMILIGSRHNSNFGLQNVNGTHYIWTTIYSESDRSQTFFGRIQYQANTVIPADKRRYQTFWSYGDKFLNVNFDSSSNKVVINRFNVPKTTEIYDLSDVLANKRVPIHTIDRVDYGFKPKSSEIDPTSMDNSKQTNRDTSAQTWQSSCLKYPYYFFDSGDINMSDERLVWGINLISKSLIFKNSLNTDMFNVGNYNFFEPETISWCMENNNPVFLFGANYDTDDKRYCDVDIEGKITKRHHVSGLWKVRFTTRASVKASSDDTDITN